MSDLLITECIAKSNYSVMYDSLHKLDLDLRKSMGGLCNNGLGVTGRKKCIDWERNIVQAEVGIYR